MRINFLVNEVFDGWEPTDARLGGTEESVVRWAEEIARRGNQVTVYRNPRKLYAPSAFSFGEVYAPRELYVGGGDICINIKSSEVRPLEPTLYLTNETNASDLDLSAYKGVIWPSQWAVDNIPVNNPNTYILPHGFEKDKLISSIKIPKQCLYASSPDRGLDVLLKAWPKVYAAHPDASLVVTYGAPANEMDGVTFLGEVDDDMMNELYKTSDVWCHPCTGGELFGMTGIKAQYARCVPVIIPTMALKETVKHGYFADSADDYADVLIAALHDTVGRNKVRDKLRKEHFVDWKESTDQLLKIIESVV